MSRSPENFPGYVPPAERVPLTPESQAEFETLLHVISEVLRREHKVNEGNNGIIFRVRVEQPSENKEVKEYAMKLLKIGRYELLHDEYENQKRAYDIVQEAMEESDSPDQYAKIPEPTQCHEMSVDTEISDHLEEEGIRMPGEKVGILMMDWIEGEDLATHLFKEVLQRKHSNYLDRGIDLHNFNQLHAAVEREFDFAKPGGKAPREGDRIFEQRKVQNENEEKVYKFLKKDGYVFPAETVQKIKNTIDLLKEKGLAVWDSHARNIMIDENEQNPYLIDFAPQWQPVGDEEERTLDPYTLVRQLESLSMTEQQEEEQLSAAQLQQFDRDYQRYTGNSRWLENISRQNPNLETFWKNSKYEISIGIEKVDDYLFALLYKLEHGEVTQQEVESFLSEMQEDHMPHWRKEKINLAIKKAGN